MNGILWVLRTGAPWADLPGRYPSFQTCHRRFQHWVHSGVMTKIMAAFAYKLIIRGDIDVREPRVSHPLKKGLTSGRQNAAREQRSWQSEIVTDCRSVCVESASPLEVTLATSTLVQMVIPGAPQDLIGDNAHGSDRLDTQLKFYGIELIAPHRRNRKNKTQDQGRVKRYQRRGKIERLFAWLRNFRRLVVRYERHAENFLGMLHLASTVILLRYL